MIIKRTIILGQYLFLLVLTSIFAHAQAVDTKLNITVPKHTYVLGEPIFMNITLTSSKDVFVLKSLEDYLLRCVVTDINGNKRISKGNRINVERRLTEADFFRVDMGNPYHCRKNIIAEYFSDVELGRFKIKFIFDKLTEPLPKNVEGKVAGYQESNEIEVFIKKPAGQDLSAFELISSQTNSDKVKSFFDSVLSRNLRNDLVRNYPDSIYYSVT